MTTKNDFTRVELARGQPKANPVESSYTSGDRRKTLPQSPALRALAKRAICQCARILPAIVLAFLMVMAPATSRASVSVGIVLTTVQPPPLVYYEQPICPGPNFIWTPGYWAWGPAGYFWVPGTWVMAPYPGELWTPGYWAWDNDDDAYSWVPGYWGPEVGFYGGVVYGFGYFGAGYQGGYWRNGTFFYNTAVNRVDTTTITNVYNRTVINNTTVTNVSYNGGVGGTTARPTAAQLAVAHQRHDPPTPVQRQQEQVARSNRAQFASVNHGVPPVAATAKPGAFAGPGVVRAKASAQPAVALNRAGAANQGNPRTANPSNKVMPPPADTHPNVATPGGNAKPNARPIKEPPAKNQNRHEQSIPVQRETKNQASPHRQPPTETHARPSKPNPPHAQEKPRDLTQQREMTPPRKGPQPAPAQRGTARTQNAPHAMPREVSPQHSNPVHPTSTRQTTPPSRDMARVAPERHHATARQQSVPPSRSVPREAPPRGSSSPHSATPASAQHRTPHSPNGGR